MEVIDNLRTCIHSGTYRELLSSPMAVKRVQVLQVFHSPAERFLQEILFFKHHSAGHFLVITKIYILNIIMIIMKYEDLKQRMVEECLIEREPTADEILVEIESQ
jgi:hypothetical protein